MKFFTIICFTLLSFGSLLSQDSKKVSLKLTYKGNPLCNWDVTIKYGDVAIGTGKTDENGKVDFGYVRLVSNGIDAYGYKKTANGDKKWDVKGYITLNEQGHADFDFQPLVDESGMGGMMETAWGLTLNDCGGLSGSSGNSGSSSTASSDETKKDQDEWEKQQDAKQAEQKAKDEQFQKDWESGKTQAEGLQNSKQMQENKIATLSSKIEKKKAELTKLKSGTKDYSDVQYDIRDLEIEKGLTELKLEKTNKMIANNNSPISKADKLALEAKEDPLKAEQDSLKQAQKGGALYDVASTSEVKSAEQNKDAGNADKTPETEEDDNAIKLYTAAELTELSVMNIKKLKLDANSKITSRKVSLKTKSSMMKPVKIAQYEKDIVDLEKQVELFDAELAKRKATE